MLCSSSSSVRLVQHWCNLRKRSMHTQCAHTHQSHIVLKLARGPPTVLWKSHTTIRCTTTNRCLMQILNDLVTQLQRCCAGADTGRVTGSSRARACVRCLLFPPSVRPPARPLTLPPHPAGDLTGARCNAMMCALQSRVCV